MSRRSALMAILVSGVGAACRAPRTGLSSDSSLDSIAEQYVRCTLQLAQHQPSLIEGWHGPPEWRPGARKPVVEIRHQIETLRERLRAGETASPRFLYLSGQIDALTVAARRLSGESMPFIDEARASFGERIASVMTAGSESEAQLVESARAWLEEHLPGKDALVVRYADFRRRHALPAQQLLPAVQACADVCRRHVSEHIALPESESIRFEIAPQSGVEARASYESALVTRVSVDPTSPTDLARLLWVVAHETYPGHHVQHLLAAHDLPGRGPERALFPAFGPHLFVSEGAAEAGAAWLLDGDMYQHLCGQIADRIDARAMPIEHLVQVQRAVAALDVLVVSVAERYLDGKLSHDAAAELLGSALVLDANQLLSVIERQRTRVVAYPIGRRLVAARLNAVPKEQRWKCLAEISQTLTLGSTSRVR